METGKCPVCSTEIINQCGIDELIEYSLNVEYWEEEAAKLCEIIATMRSKSKENKERELKIWYMEGIKISNNYLMFAEFGRQRCLEEPLNSASMFKFAQDLAATHEERIKERVRR